jgi:hypothetical protein
MINCNPYKNIRTVGLFQSTQLVISYLAIHNRLIVLSCDSDYIENKTKKEKFGFAKSYQTTNTKDFLRLTTSSVSNVKNHNSRLLNKYLGIAESQTEVLLTTFN